MKKKNYINVCFSNENRKANIIEKSFDDACHRHDYDSWNTLSGNGCFQKKNHLYDGKDLFDEYND